MPEVDDSWYSAVSGAEVHQGDIFLELNVPVVSSVKTEADGTLTAMSEIEIVDVVVLSQTCDLIQRRGSDVLVCQVVSWEGVVDSEIGAGNSFIAGKDFRAKLINGSITHLSLLHKRDEPPALPWSVANFRRLYTVGRDYLDTVLAERLDGQRLRLVPPYREHLAQAFARYFMRVGLPHVAADFEFEGADIVRQVRERLRAD